MVRRLGICEVASLLGMGVALVVAAPAPAATPGFPSQAQMATCIKAAMSHSNMTKSQMSACAGFPFISQHCPSGPTLKVISAGSTNVAIRQGHKPVKLGKNYTITQLKAACGKTPKSNGLAAPGKPASPSQPPTANVSSLMAGTAHPVIPLPAGIAKKVTLVYVGTPVANGALGSIVPVAVWNGSSSLINHIDISGPAKDGTGAVIGSGDSQDVEPQNVPPGDVAFGMVFFETPVPVGSDLSALSATYETGQSTYFVDMKTQQANLVPGSYGASTITGEVMNTSNVSLHGPISTVGYCFSPSGVFLDVVPGFASGDATIAPGQTAGFSDSMYNTTCPTFLVGASGYGS